MFIWSYAMTSWQYFRYFFFGERTRLKILKSLSISDPYSIDAFLNAAGTATILDRIPSELTDFATKSLLVAAAQEETRDLVRDRVSEFPNGPPQPPFWASYRMGMCGGYTWEALRWQVLSALGDKDIIPELVSR